MSAILKEAPVDQLYENMYRLLASTPNQFVRYLYPHIHWESRMLGIVGPRGVGKTTLLLQHILNSDQTNESLFVFADSMYFSEHTLFDTAEAFSKNGGTFLYIDEVHKYEGWSRELKAIYDSFPHLHVRFTGSSVLDIEKGEADLSRRAPKYHLQGLSFREFLAMRHNISCEPYTLEEILAHKAAIPEVEHPLPLFREYLASGYYPFGSDPEFEIELGQVIMRTLEVDIPQFANMNAATGRKLKRLMALISTMAPFKPSMASIAGKIEVSRNNLEDYFMFMEKAGMIARLRQSGSSINLLGKVEKVYLDNPNILMNLGDESSDRGTIRETFFFNQMRVNHLVTASPRIRFRNRRHHLRGGRQEQRFRSAAECGEGICGQGRHRVRLRQRRAAVGLRPQLLGSSDTVPDKVAAVKDLGSKLS